MNIEIEALNPTLGAIVHGWEPEAPISKKTRQTILDALRQHIVLVFRGNPQPSDTALVHFASGFGELVKGSEWFQDNGDYAEILRVNNVYDKEGVPQGTGGSTELGWHADYSYVPRVGKESFLNAVEIPENPPRTCFCNQYRALETLPEKTVAKLRTLRAFHSITNYISGDESQSDETSEKPGAVVTSETRAGFKAKRERNRELGIEKPDIPQAEHPLIMTHPDTGREILYVSPQIIKFIIGMPKAESDELIEELTEHSLREENIYRHDWQVGDTVMFDTLGSLHRRDSWDPAQRRIMRQLSTML
ncbi:MAG: TauD/TfdA family dioxygenase [Porticoccaceae bacterium]|nr:TauD/TfdA family dioxygenase [Porticoccaceae bacterium]